MTNILDEVLKPELVKLRLESSTKDDLIRELVGLLAEAGLLKNRAEVELAVLKREAVLSTGMEDGIAIPHGKTDTVERLLVAVGLKPDGVDFGCADGKPARILILAVSPASRSGPHIQFLASISQVLHKPEIRERLVRALSAEEVVETLQRG